VGRRDVRIKGPETAALNPDQILAILRKLDEAHFTTLEDRAFSWCFDSSSVEISVSVDGKTKTVVSDSGCTGSKGGPQDRFVQTADEIDKMIGSERWVKCDDSFCR
jgi:hypothetical protein